jgi:hypothetical protein
MRSPAHLPLTTNPGNKKNVSTAKVHQVDKVPIGPSVTLTAFDRMSMPRSIRSRASV